MIITRTPYRLSFFGGGTDYNPWYEENGGFVLAVGIAHYCYLSVRYLPPFFSHKSRIVYSKIESINSIANIQHPSVKGCLEYMNISDGVEIHHDGDLPARSGMGSSSVFIVGLMNILNNLQGNQIGKKKLAEKKIKGIVNLGNGNSRKIEEVVGILKKHFPKMKTR